MQAINFVTTIPNLVLETIDSSILKVWEVVKRVFAYIASTLSYCYCYFFGETQCEDSTSSDTYIDSPNNSTTSPDQQYFHPYAADLGPKNISIIERVVEHKGHWVHFLTDHNKRKELMLAMNPFSVMDYIGSVPELREKVKTHSDKIWTSFQRSLTNHMQETPDDSIISIANRLAHSAFRINQEARLNASAHIQELISANKSTDLFRYILEIHTPSDADKLRHTGSMEDSFNVDPSRKAHFRDEI